MSEGLQRLVELGANIKRGIAELDAKLEPHRVAHEAHREAIRRGRIMYQMMTPRCCHCDPASYFGDDS